MNNESEESIVQDTQLLLEEYKVLVDQNRFVMTRYMQAAAIYIALIGFSLKEVITVDQLTIMLILSTLISLLNFVGYYIAIHFRGMAYHTLNKQTEVANKLNFQPPYPLIWGYYSGIILVTVVQLTIILIILLRLGIISG